jgi:hypothetical protein
MMAEQMPPNATTLERLEFYSKHAPEKGQALARLADYLEECFLWEIEFHPED